jgi:hypothetical protein
MIGIDTLELFRRALRESDLKDCVKGWRVASRVATSNYMKYICNRSRKETAMLIYFVYKLVSLLKALYEPYIWKSSLSELIWSYKKILNEDWII